MAAGGENRWPYLGRNRWPLTFTNNGPGPSKLICIHASPTFIGEWLE
jgi:hypothetical protein